MSPVITRMLFSPNNVKACSAAPSKTEMFCRAIKNRNVAIPMGIMNGTTAVAFGLQPTVLDGDYNPNTIALS